MKRNRKTHFAFDKFLPKIPAVYEKMWKNIVQLDRLLMTSQYGASALHTI